MKRKLFSAILFGALLTASTSGLTSCKDYDDDISNLQSQIDKLATKEELKLKAEDLEGKIKTAQNAANAASEVAKAAKDAAAAASSDAKAANDAAAAAQTAADNAQAAADAVAADLKKAVENAASQIQEAVKNLATKDEVAAAVKEVADKYDAQAKDLKALSDRLDKVEAKLGLGEGGEDIDLTEIQAELEDIEDALIELVGDVQNMPTSVELMWGTTMEFTMFEEQKNEFGKDYLASPIQFTKGATKYSSSKVYIRVNPVNADITGMVNNISLINSQGKEISDLIKVKSVQRYTGQLTNGWNTGAYTRSIEQTGLWEVEFAPADGVKANDLKAAFIKQYYDWQGQPSNWSYINYAVSLNNVAGEDTINTSFDETRRLVTAYNVNLDYKKAIAYDADFNYSSHKKPTTPAEVNYISLQFSTEAEYGRNLSTIPNRAADYWWNESEITRGTGSDKVTVMTPATSMIKKDADHPYDYNVGSYTDNRVNSNPLPANPTYKNVVAKVGEKIYIDFNNVRGGTQTKPIKGFFVVLDGKNAESASSPSEINAWNSYIYENVGKVGEDGKLLSINGTKQYSTFQEGNSGYITIKDLYGEATGDEIGFRIYAVNLDGTLVDPDGIAFYVTVGQSASDINIGANTVTVVNKATYTPAYNFTKGTLKGIDYVNWTISLSWDQVVDRTYYSVEYHVNGGGWDASYNTNNAAKYDGVRFKLTEPKYFQDNATYAIAGAAKKAASGAATAYTKFTMAGNLTKVLPQTAPGFTWNEGQNEEQIVKTRNYDNDIEDALRLAGLSGRLSVNQSIWVNDVDAFVTKDGNLNYNDMFIQTKSGNPAINADNKFIFALANTKYNKDAKDYTDPMVTTGGTTAPYSYNAKIAASLVDCATPHALTCDYNYGDITSQTDEKGGYIDYKVSASTGYNIKYMSWSYKNANYLTFTWAKGNNGQSGNNYKEWTYDVNQTLDEVKIATDRFKTVYGSKLTTNLRQPTLKDYLKIGWLKIVDVKTIGVETGIVNPYYEWDPTTSSTDYTVLGLKMKAGVENVPAHSEKVQITVIDCFGHQETHEFILKFTIEPVDHVLTPTA